MSILSDAWHRSRGEEEVVSRVLGALPLPGVQRRGRILPWVLCAVLAIIVVGLSVYVWRIEAMRGGVASGQRQSSRAIPSAAAVTRYPWESRNRAKRSRISLSSSTTRMWASPAMIPTITCDCPDGA